MSHWRLFFKNLLPGSLLPGSLLPVGWDVAESVGTRAGASDSEVEPRTELQNHPTSAGASCGRERGNLCLALASVFWGPS